MTTIAYRDGVMSGDGRETSEGPNESALVIRDNCKKVFKLADGRLFGASKGSEDIERLYRALQNGDELFPVLADVNGLLIDTDGKMWLYEGTIWQPLEDVEYYAIGSGSIYAFAAMDMGASAEEAVLVGTKRDPYSGGKISSVKLK